MASMTYMPLTVAMNAIHSMRVLGVMGLMDDVAGVMNKCLLARVSSIS